MTMTPREQIESAAATAEFMEDFLEDLEAIRDEAQAYKSNVSLFPRIFEAAHRMEAQLTHAKLIADWITQENEDFRREGEARLAAERDAQATAKSGATDRRTALVDRIKDELEDMDIGADARVVVHVAVIEDEEDDFPF